MTMTCVAQIDQEQRDALIATLVDDTTNLLFDLKDIKICPHCAYELLLMTLLRALKEYAEPDMAVLIKITMKTLSLVFEEVQFEEVPMGLPH